MGYRPGSLIMSMVCFGVTKVVMGVEGIHRILRQRPVFWLPRNLWFQIKKILHSDTRLKKGLGDILLGD